LYTFSRTNNVKQKIYNLNSSELGIPAERASVPVLFVAYPNRKIKYVFMPDKNIPKLTEQYLKFIQTKL